MRPGRSSRRAGVVITTIALVAAALSLTTPAHAAPVHSSIVSPTLEADASVQSSAQWLVLSNPPAAGGFTDDPQQKESAGNYVYVCVLTSGYSYTIGHGTRLSSCSGSRIQQYLYGALQQSVAISGSPRTVRASTVTIGCLIAGAALAVGVWAVITSFGTLTVVSGLISVAGLAYCKA